MSDIHQTSTQSVRTTFAGAYGGSWEVRCICGWHDEMPWSTRHLARQSGDDHLAAMERQRLDREGRYGR